MFSSIQSIPGLIFARSDVKAKIQPEVKASKHGATMFFCLTCMGTYFTIRM